MVNISYINGQGRLPRNSIKAVENSSLRWKLEFELKGSMMESILVSCSTEGDYQQWIFLLQKPEQCFSPVSDQALPLIPKKRRS
nr:PREDICTED: rho guanine nucleotide exchange factor 7-like isoform X2 [Latimeria chalumnae]|eukprot:XP_005986054.1 PREDICTED: rho guanine nucleotide exchange factor 7-like isoform X2 [Latimeria chalumnae]